MASIKVSLLVKFSVICGGKGEYKIELRKVQELFVYLPVLRNHPQPRESLRKVLRADQSAIKSRNFYDKHYGTFNMRSDKSKIYPSRIFLSAMAVYKLFFPPVFGWIPLSLNLFLT